MRCYILSLRGLRTPCWDECSNEDTPEPLQNSPQQILSTSDVTPSINLKRALLRRADPAYPGEFQEMRKSPGERDPDFTDNLHLGPPRGCSECRGARRITFLTLDQISSPRSGKPRGGQNTCRSHREASLSYRKYSRGIQGAVWIQKSSRGLHFPSCTRAEDCT